MLSFLGLIIGGVLRLAPELLHLFTAKQEAAAEAQRRQDQNAHEALMYDKQAAHEREMAAVEVHKVDAASDVAFMQAAAASQGPLVDTGNRWLNFVNGVTALLRPLITLWLFGLYAAVRTAQLTFTLAAAVHEGFAATGSGWLDVFSALSVALAKIWADPDNDLLKTILGYWFLDRTIHHLRND